MRITRLILENYRGWERLDLRPSGHVLLAGVPRSGRSDIISALRRLLDPSVARTQPAVTDLYRSAIGSLSAEGATDSTAPMDSALTSSPVAVHGAVQPDGARPQAVLQKSSYALVEVCLADLDEEVEQLCSGYLEPLTTAGVPNEDGQVDDEACFGVRLAWRLSYDAEADALEQVTYFPVSSQPAIGQYERVPTALRTALPVVAVGASRPLQLRTEGLLRRLLTDYAPSASAEAFAQVQEAVGEAAARLSSDPTIAGSVGAVLQAGGLTARLGDQDVSDSDITFQAEDGSLTALLRALQPFLRLDGAGMLPLAAHGSTTTAVLGAAEALLTATTAPSAAVVLVDDLGDQLDSATTEHVAAKMRACSGQLWATTRRPEAARAFEPDELVRLTRHQGARAVHTLSRPTNRKAVVLQRMLHSQLLPALTSPAVVIVEGPQDVAALSLADRRRAGQAQPLAATGARLISADNGAGGGTGQIPRVAELAHELGFHVVALVDGDRPSAVTIAALEQIQSACDAVVCLPEGVAVEAAITTGVDVDELRTAADSLVAYGIPDPTTGCSDAAVAPALWKVVHKQSLHEPLLEALLPRVGVPPMLAATLDDVKSTVEALRAGTLSEDFRRRTVVLRNDHSTTGPQEAPS